MKKSKFLMMMGATLMVCASCTNDVLVDNPVIDSSAIEFGSFAEVPGVRAPKAAGYSFVIGDKMTVQGFETYATDGTEHKIFDYQMVENTAGQNNQIWSYSPKKYWTSGNTYEFYGSFPYEQKFVFSDASKLYTLDNFTVDNDTAKQVDLMIAERNYATPNNTVEMIFHHILSNVNFYAKVSPDVNPEEITSVDIIKLDVDGLLSTGSYKQTSWTENHQAVGSWTTTPDKFYDFPGISNGKSTALKVGEGYPSKGIATGLLLMPQTLFYKGIEDLGTVKVDSATLDPTIEVTFKVSYSDNTSQQFTRSLRLSSIKSYEKKTLLEDGTYKTETVATPIYQWLPNYKYNYTLAFNPAKTTRVWEADSDGDKPGNGGDNPEKDGGSKYNPDDPNVIQVYEDTDGDGTPDSYVEYPVVWEDIDGDGKLEGGVDKDGDGHIDNVDGNNDTACGGDDKYDPTDGDDVNNPDGKDVILVHVDTDGDGDVDEDDEWVQLEKDPETGEITPAKETEENYIEFTAVVSDWEVEYGVNYDITK